MQKINREISRIGLVFYLIYFSSLCGTNSLNFPEIGNIEFQYDQLEEYEELFKEIECEIDQADSSFTAGVFGKWTKKLKNWFKNRCYCFFKKCLKIKKIEDPEDAAHYVAKFRKKIMRYVDPGKMEMALSKFDDSVIPDSEKSSFLAFQSRIRYYDENFSKYPDREDADRYNFYSASTREEQLKQIENIPTKALIGGVEFFCGALIYAIPLPGCQWIGGSLMGLGTTHICDAYINEAEKRR